MKKIIFDGRIGTGAEVRSTNGGKPYLRFTVANNSFINSQEVTEWFEVTSYDQHVIENRAKALTKGTYVIISGQLNTKTNVKDNKVWVNQYVTAESIDIPYLGKKNEDEQGVKEIKESIANSAPTTEVSTYTPKQTSAPAPSAPTQDSDAEDDELPF